MWKGAPSFVKAPDLPRKQTGWVETLGYSPVFVSGPFAAYERLNIGPRL